MAAISLKSRLTSVAASVVLRTPCCVTTRLTIFLLLGLLVLISPYAIAGHLVTLHDLQTLEEATYLQVSPKGDLIAYVWKDRLWIASTQTGNSPRQFERAKVPRWSKDGQKIAYYSDESGANQLWVLDVHKGSAEQVTNLPGGIDPDPLTAAFWFYDPLRYSWSPDGSKIVFVSRVVAPNSNDKPRKHFLVDQNGEETRPLILDNSTPADWTLSGILRKESNRPKWSPGQEEQLPPTKLSQLFVVDVTTKRTEQITNDQFGYYQPDWSPDGREILFVTNGGRQPKHTATSITNVYVLDLLTGEKTALTKGLHENRVPAWSPNGKWVAFLGRQGLGQESLYVIARHRGKAIN